MKLGLYVILVTLFFGCASQKNVENKNDSKTLEQVKSEVTELLGNDVIFQNSTNNSYILCSKEPLESSLNPNELTEFYVFDLKTNKEIYKDKISGAKISWQSDYEILVVKQKGIVTSPEDDGKDRYLIDVKTGKTKTYTKLNQKDN